MKRISILGSTGSIGRQVLDVIDSLGPEYRVVALAAGSSDQMLADQILRYKPEIAAINDLSAAARLIERLKPEKYCIITGSEGQMAAATWPSADLVIMAQVGFSGFEPLVAALKEGKTIALANKESLVVGGEILERMGLLNREKIIPLDSEHSAIRQCLDSSPIEEVNKIYLTASGGPFFGMHNNELQKVTPKMALNHPNWSMGSKITIDSATMINKGLEVMEAKWLFGLNLDQIEVIVHRQSIIHSMVEYIDGTIIAQLGLPDMRLPIQYALTYPERKTNKLKRYNPYGESLSFEKPDMVNFPGLELAFRAAEAGGTMPAVFNGANEISVSYFLNGDINFVDIPVVIDSVMKGHKRIINPEISDVLRADDWSRKKADEFIAGLKGKVI